MNSCFRGEFGNFISRKALFQNCKHSDSTICTEVISVPTEQAGSEIFHLHILDVAHDDVAPTPILKQIFCLIKINFSTAMQILS